MNFKSRTLFSSGVISLAMCLALSAAAFTQQKTRSPDQQPMGGASTGAARTYATRRTVGITDPNAPVAFEDVTARTELSAFKHRAGSAAKDYILDTPSGGVALFDYDGDGRIDIYLLNGSTVEALRGKDKPPRAALYRNLGNWRF